MLSPDLSAGERYRLARAVVEPAISAILPAPLAETFMHPVLSLYEDILSNDAARSRCRHGRA